MLEKKELLLKEIKKISEDKDRQIEAACKEAAEFRQKSSQLE